MMESKANMGSEVHVIVFPYPIQGHINPMLQFSKQLASRGLNVTLATTSSFSSKFHDLKSSSITIETISDGSTEAATPGTVEEYMKKFDVVAPKSLTQLVEHKIGIGHNVRCLVYDSGIPWALDIAKKFDIQGASFFTQSCLVSLIFYQVHQGILSIPVEGPEICVPGMTFDARDVPSFVRRVGLHPSLEKLVINQFSNCGDANWRFFNTFDGLESKVVDWMASQWAVKTIGPCIPSMYLDKRLEDDKDYGLSLFKAQTDACIQWLDARESASVVYISMGSLASLGGEQMVEIAKGLEKSNKFFLWVVRALEESKLPLNFKEKTSNKGLIVNWCPQLEVLAHSALGCFVTHCGWNSTLEAVSLGVPMVAFPQWTDQPTNAKCIVDFWRTGVRVKVDDQGFLNSDELEFSIREVMEGERAKEIRSNATKWKQLTKEAMEEGGSSDRNIEEFIAKLLSYS
ncbi:UDP-glycosyltransferase 74E2-like isoform X2 [Chenopodium quinoa]|uniref:UDP-glycosyltransferase 74E2-like isoform X2 n=1 Tax=Chenopodium quinoa TaxID=63459 RepID=UPI000B786DF8|nr:UDP-glycosyltransferase 74E2-like isoform X2 [Chenopodium quinoa]